mgnify:FL=1
MFRVFCFTFDFVSQHTLNSSFSLDFHNFKCFSHELPMITDSSFHQNTFFCMSNVVAAVLPVRTRERKKERKKRDLHSSYEPCIIRAIDELHDFFCNTILHMNHIEKNEFDWRNGI